ncbi:PPR: pentatricopeptide repeat domain containing protein [Nitzschia inconspicua]|uniref:PPR: pentatricopeptide repeat domain containing protein n=1 Tax=Nitzschia inconspicua TaxID=303405 RepID=A0A9K3PFK6_9STRA|nr:PPR: pentatricopeptide repeat domain containing protein [Nitzschia inconspicua]
MAQASFDRLMELNPDDSTALQAMDWLLEAWSKSTAKDAPLKAERILKQMKDIQKDNTESSFSYPNRHSYTNAILAWSKSKEEGSALKAHRMLFQLLDEYEKGNLPDESVPDLFGINGVISAWARAGKAERAEEVLWRANEISKKCKSVEPNVVTYNSVVHAYLRDGDLSKAIYRILPIVEYMIEHKEQNPGICPDCFTYHCVLRAWEKNKDKVAVKKCVETLETMHQLWELGDTSLAPKNVFYNMVINKLAKATDDFGTQSVMRIFHLLQKSPYCSPDIISYTSVIESLSKCQDPIAAERCLELFNEVSQLYEENEDPALKPNLRTYTMVLLSLTKIPTLDNVLQAQKLLLQLEERYKESNDPQLKPNTYPYNYVLNCAASCVGNAGEKLKAFHVATETYNAMRKSDHIKSDSYTYSFWIKASNNLLPEGELRAKCIALSFEQCKKEGLVNEAVLRRLLAGTPQNVLDHALPSGLGSTHANHRRLSVDDLPPHWTRNAR